MTPPKRIQIRRTKGWRMPSNTLKVDRSTKWGNPFRSDMPTYSERQAGAKSAAQSFEWWLRGSAPALLGAWPERREVILRDLHELRGKDLACWCGPDDECHADVLLRMANGEGE